MDALHAPVVDPHRSRATAPAARRIIHPCPFSSNRSPFDAAAEAARLRDQTRARRRRRHAVSRLDRYTLELLALHDAGSTPAELRRWLADRRVRVHHSTVARWLRRRLAD